MADSPEPGIGPAPATPEPVTQTVPPEEPTVGTGSAVALGCIVGTVLLMLVGILLVLWLR